MAILAVCQSADNAICPVEAFRGYPLFRIGKVFRGLVDIGIEGHKGVEGIGAEANPFQNRIFLGHIRTNLGKA